MKAKSEGVPPNKYLVLYQSMVGLSVPTYCFSWFFLPPFIGSGLSNAQCVLLDEIINFDPNGRDLRRGGESGDPGRMSCVPQKLQWEKPPGSRLGRLVLLSASAQAAESKSSLYLSPPGWHCKYSEVAGFSFLNWTVGFRAKLLKILWFGCKIK